MTTSVKHVLLTSLTRDGNALFMLLSEAVESRVQNTSARTHTRGPGHLTHNFLESTCTYLQRKLFSPGFFRLSRSVDRKDIFFSS